MIDNKFLVDVIDTLEFRVFTHNGRWFRVFYDESFMDSFIGAFNPEDSEDEIKVYFYECALKPTQVFKKKFFDRAVELFNARLN